MASILDIASSQSMADSLNEGHPLECTICLERMKEISFLTTQPDSNGNVCNHCFCTACIQRIVSRAEDPKCPVCRRSVLAVNRSRVANELLHELDNEREQRKKALYDKEELIGEVKELVEERDKLSQEISQLRKAHADELAKESAKVKSQIEKFRKACEIQLEEERKDKDITIKTLQQQLKEATLASDQWKKKFDKEKTLGDSKRVEDLMRENTKLNAELEIRSKELDASSSTLLERTKALKAKTKECEEMLEKLEEKSNEVEAKNYQLELKAKEYEHLRGLFEIKLRELQGKDQEISYKEEQVVRLQEQIELLKNQSEAYTMQLEMKKREILDIKNEMQKLSSEVEKWQSLYRRALEEMQSKKPEPVENQDTSPSKNSVLASWLTPSLTKQLSSFWTKTGPLVKSATKIEFQERRGSSRNSEVWRALTANGSSKGVALKRISQPESHEGFREAMILHKVDHINILKLNGVLRGVQIPGKNVIGDLMILPYVQYDLEYVLGQNPFKLKINQVRFILYQTLSALVYLHSGEVVHRDIKPTSILLDENYNVKLGSFGQARSTLSQPFNPLYLPINRYSTPEACHLRETTRTSVVWKAGDIWSLGCVFFEMLKGSPLFDAKDKTQLLSQIFSVTECKASNTDLMKYALLNVIEPSKRESSIVDSLRSSSLVDVSLESLDLLKFMLAFEPTKRIQASEALKHRFFTENKLSEVHRTCPLQSELTDANLPPFTDLCGGL